MNEKNKKYDLFLSKRIYETETLASFYYRSKVPVVKKFKPIDVNGERLKLDLETGEMRRYTKPELNVIAAASIRRTLILLNMLLSMNAFDWFCTLTFDPARVDRSSDLAVYETYVKYIKSLKRKFLNFRYVSIPERHETGEIHFHLFIGGISTKDLGLVNSGKVCCSWATRKKKIASLEYFERTKEGKILKETDGLVVYNITSFPFGYTTATRIANREACNYYVKKYIEKAFGSTDIFKKRFFYSNNLRTPELVRELIGADFDTPTALNNSKIINKHAIYRFAKQERYISDYNTLQVRIDNEIVKVLDKGLEPVLDKETIAKVNEIFGE